MAKSDKPRIVITVTEEMRNVAKLAAKEKSNNLSGITRLALYEWLKRNGYEVSNWYVEWGGDRKDDE